METYRIKINPHFFTFPFWCGYTVCFIAYLSPYLFSWTRGAGFMGVPGLGLPEGMILVGLSPIIFAEIYFLISLYRCWSILQGSTTRTTPGKAVGFLFIPIFNLYWFFVAIRGLAKDAKIFLESKNMSGPKINVGLSTALCILGIIPYFNGIFAPFLQNILIYQWANFFNYSVTTLGVKYK